MSDETTKREVDPKAPGALCDRCPLYEKTYVPSFVPNGAQYACIGEAPGYNEAQQGIPFVGQSGQLLSAAFKRVGVDFENVWRSNIVSCWPPNNREPTPLEIKCCRPRLLRELKEFNGDAILPVGKTAGMVVLAEAGYGILEKATDRRGHWYEWDGKKVMPTWHPAYVMRRPNSAMEFFDDIGKLVNGSPQHHLQNPPEVIFVYTVDELREMVEAIPEGATVAYDVETEQLIWYDRPGQPADRVLMLGVSWDVTKGYVIDPKLFDPRYENMYPGFESDYWQEGNKLLNEMFARPDIRFSAHNGKFDLIVLRTAGVYGRCDFDTLLAHYTVNELRGTHGLKRLALEYYGLRDYEVELVKRHMTSRNDKYSKIPYLDLGLYCIWDVIVTLQLTYDLEEAMIKEGLLEEPFYSLLMPLQQALTEVEWRGVPLNVEYLREWQLRLLDHMDDLIDKLAGYADDPDFNPNSPTQVAHIIYEQLGLPRPKPGTNIKPNSTSKQALAPIVPGQSEFVDVLREYRRAHKINRTYMNMLQKFASINGRVHPSGLVHGTEVGRLAFRDPSIQTIPRPYEDMYGAMIRSAFVAPEGYKMVMADYSQAELRVAAVLSGDPFLIDSYVHDRDLHSEVAFAMYGEDYTMAQRNRCKMFNFSYLYGGSVYSFARDSELPIDVARDFVLQYNRVMPVLAEYKRNQFKQAKTLGYVKSPFGRKRRFPLITNANKDDVRKSATHAPVAGTASDLTQFSLIEAEKQGMYIIMTVHDSIVVLSKDEDAEADAVKLQSIMHDTAAKFFPEVPWKVDVDITDRWAPKPEEIHGEAVRKAFGEI